MVRRRDLVFIFLKGKSRGQKEEGTGISDNKVHVELAIRENKQGKLIFVK